MYRQQLCYYGNADYSDSDVSQIQEIINCDTADNEENEIKIISKEMLKKKKGGHSSETYFEDIKREIAIMKKLLHPNVLRLFEVLDDPKVCSVFCLSVCLHLCLKLKTCFLFYLYVVE